MVQIKKTEFQAKRRERNDEIAHAFLVQKTEAPGAPNADCIRGLAEHFEVSEATVRIALKESKLI